MTLKSIPNARNSRLVAIAIGAIALLGAGFLQAQNTDATDTAPGGATAPAVVAPSPSDSPVTPVAPVPVTAPAPDLVTPTVSSTVNIVPNGGLQSDSKGAGWPDGWGSSAPANMSWQQEDGKHFIRMASPAPDTMVMLYHEVKIPAGVKAVEIAFRYRVTGLQKGTQNYFDARSMFHFLDGKRQPVKPDPGVITFSSGTWTDASERTLVPDGATTLVLMPALFKVAAGTLDLGEIRVTPLDGDTAGGIASAEAAAAATQAEQNAILAKEMAQPSTSQEIHTSGNQLVTADGKPVILQGVNIDSLEWSATGDHILWATHVALNDWHATILRLPVMNTFWFGKGKGAQTSNNPDAYRQLIDSVVKLAATHGAYVMIDLHRFLAPDDDCALFWTDAAARYKNNPAVIFDLFNEPHDISWDLWKNGGMVPVQGKEPFHSPGMQGLIDAVRATGAKNIVVCGGLGYAFDLSGVLNGYALDDKGGNGIMYATHFYNWHKGWQDHFLNVAEKYPVIVGEFGADIKKMNFIPADQQEDPYTWAPDALGMVQKYHLNWTAFSFHTRSTPVLLSDWNFTPSPFWGAFVKDALAGKQFEMKNMR